MNEYRTHKCNELREADEGKEVKLSGFVKTIRDLGGCVFIDLRDHYGITQLTTEDPKLLEQIKEINVEAAITVEGTVVKRPVENINDKLETGKIEVELKKIIIQNNVLLPMPFEVEKSHDVKEDLRLQYRFLDLRNESIHEKIVFRSKVLKCLRDKMDSMGFVEVQTPILTSSSPEGARDYLIPSRLHPGEFYALPQAPQQFNPRADRSPGEFYQLDFEMSFATQEDVLNVLKEVTTHIFKTYGHATISEDSFEAIPYKVAMEKYGTDKPDLRNPLVLTDVTDCFAASSFNAFKNKTVKAIAIDSSSVTRRFFDEMVDFAKSELGMKGLAWIKINEDSTVVGPIAKYLSEDILKDMFQKTGAKENYGIFFIADEYLKACKDAGNVRNELGKRLGLIDENVYKFCFIVDFPFYEETDDGKIDFGHNPFSMPQGGLEALETKNPLEILAYQFDMVGNGYELASGAVRNHDTEIMTKAFEIAGYSEDTVKNKFGALYNAFKYGAPPHAGAAPGIDRMIMLLLGETNIREVIAFPKNSKARDLLMQAPNYVTEEQLRDVHIKVDIKDNK